MCVVCMYVCECVYAVCVSVNGRMNLTHTYIHPPTTPPPTKPNKSTKTQISALPREVAAWAPPEGLRPKEGCVVGEGCQLGEQVNIKSSVIGAGCKVGGCVGGWVRLWWGLGVDVCGGMEGVGWFYVEVCVCGLWLVDGPTD